MSTQPEALKCADELSRFAGDNGLETVRRSIAELRRLHEENKQLRSKIQPQSDNVGFEIEVRRQVFGGEPVAFVKPGIVYISTLHGDKA